MQKISKAGTPDSKTTDFAYLGLSKEVLLELENAQVVKSYQCSPTGKRLAMINQKDTGDQTSYYGYNPHTDVEMLYKPDVKPPADIFLELLYFHPSAGVTLVTVRQPTVECVSLLCMCSYPPKTGGINANSSFSPTSSSSTAYVWFLAIKDWEIIAAEPGYRSANTCFNLSTVTDGSQISKFSTESPKCSGESRKQQDLKFQGIHLHLRKLFSVSISYFKV